MKILKYIKLKDNRYKVLLDNDLEIKLYDDVIVKYDLIRNKELDDKLFKEIVSYNDELEAYYKAIKYITKKLRTEKEIRKYLDKDYTKKNIDITIDKLKKDGYLNDEIYLKAYINDQINLSNVGPNKIKKNLVNLGYTEEVIKDKIELIEDSIWLDKLTKLVNKKVKINHQYSKNKLMEKLSYDMANMGYYKWMIDEVLSNVDLGNDERALEKEYNKYLLKLSKKYSGDQLKYQLKVKLLKGGFNLDDIINCLDK